MSNATSADAPEYPATVLLDGPSAYWRMAETSGSVAADDRGKDPGLYSGGVTLGGAGPLNGGADSATDFDGISGTVIVPDSPDLQLTDSFSLEAWLNPTSFSQDGGGGYPRILHKGVDAGGAAGSGYALMVNAANGYLRTDMEELSPNSAESRSAIPLNTWTHVVVTYDGAYMRFYVNGKLDNSVVTTGQVPSNSDPLILANRSDQLRAWQGRLADVAIYRSVLSSAQVQTHFGVGAPGSTRTGTVYWSWNGENAHYASGPNSWDAVQAGTSISPNDGGSLHSLSSDHGDSSVAVVNTMARAGSQSMRIVANTGSNSTGHMSAGPILLPPSARGSVGLESYYGYSMYFPSSDNGAWPPHVWDHNNILEFLGGEPRFGGPPVQFGIQTGSPYSSSNAHLYFGITVKQDGSGYASSSTQPAYRWTDPEPLLYDQWLDVVIHAKWASDTSGILELWLNDELKKSWTNVRTLAPADAGYGVQFMPQFYGPSTNAGPITMYLDEGRIGSSYSAAAP